MIYGMEGEGARSNNNNNINDDSMEVKVEVVSPQVKEEQADSTIKCEQPTTPSPSPSCSSSSSSLAAQSPLSSPHSVSVTATTTSSPSPLFQPFLPSASVHPPNRSALPFSIDNILKPTFGQRLLLHSLAAAAAAHHHQQQQQQQQLQQQLLLNRDRATTVKRETTPSPPSRRKSENQPVDLSSSSSNNNNNKSEKKDADFPVPGQTNKTDPDVPPGMVRGPNGQLWPAWVFCTRYSDRPSSGPRSRKIKKSGEKTERASGGGGSAEKRPRTAFSSEQLSKLKREFEENRYLTEERRRNLADTLGLNENQIKIWFQNKRAKLKKSSGQKGELAQMLAAQGLYNHSTVPVDEDDNPLY